MLDLNSSTARSCGIGCQSASENSPRGKTHVRSGDVNDLANFLFQLHKGGGSSILDLNLREDGVNFRRDASV
jgi:hypothetical protein